MLNLKSCYSIMLNHKPTTVSPSKHPVEISNKFDNRVLIVIYIKNSFPRSLFLVKLSTSIGGRDLCDIMSFFLKLKANLIFLSIYFFVYKKSENISNQFSSKKRAHSYIFPSIFYFSMSSSVPW